MIGKLSGIVDSIAADTLILDVGGVGYEVHASRRTLSRAGQAGDPLSLLIDTHVREDAITLFGFCDAGEQQWFRLLYSVQGVGPKAALAILSVCPPEKLGFAIAAGDANALRQADGVGPKLATRIVTELKDKAGKIDMSLSGALAGGVKVAVPVADAAAPRGIDQDAVAALVSLGYARADAYAAVAKVIQANDNAGISEIIRLALKNLSA